MANLKLNMNTEELLQLNSSTSTLNEEITMYLNNITDSCDQLSTYVRSNGITNKIANISSIINEIQTKFSTDMNELSTFLQGQLGSYESTVEEAAKALREALSFIEENFAVAA